MCPRAFATTSEARSCLAHLAKVQQGDMQLVSVRVCARAAVRVRRGAGAVLRGRQAAAQGQHVAGVSVGRRGDGEVGVGRLRRTAMRLRHRRSNGGRCEGQGSGRPQEPAVHAVDNGKTRRVWLACGAIVRCSRVAVEEAVPQDHDAVCQDERAHQAVPHSLQQQRKGWRVRDQPR